MNISPAWNAGTMNEEKNERRKRMGKVLFDNGIDSVYGIVMGSDPFYIRRYRRKDGSVIHIVQARPDRSGHVATPAEAANRKAFGKRFGTDRKKK